VRRFFLAVALLVAAPLPATATSSEEQPAAGRRELGGHQFLVSHLVEDPFSVTSFGVNLAIGVGQALGPSLDLTTFPPTILGESRWYDYTTLTNQFDYTLRVIENLSLRAGIVTGLRQGGSEGSALVVGSNLGVSGLLGVKGSVALGDGLRLSLSAQGMYGPRVNLLILQGLIDAYQVGSFAAADLYQERNALSLAATTAAAWGPIPWLGLELNLQYLHTRSHDISGSTKDGLAAAGSVEFDARPLVHWLALGADLSYRRIGSIGSGGLADQDEWSWGLYYTGRPDLVLGIEVDQVRGRLETAERSKQTVGWLNFRYSW
jgi:hypothetical protein